MNSEDKQLLVEVAIAASNHGLHKQAYALLAIFLNLLETMKIEEFVPV